MDLLCTREQKKVRIDKPSFKVLDNGRIRAYGTCPSCGGNAGQIIRADAAPVDVRTEADKKKAEYAAKGAAKRKPRKSVKREK